MPASNTESPAATTAARSPFNKPQADVILRSSDNVDFRVGSAILAEASPFFADMFTLPQPAGHIEPIGVSEDSKVLDSLLRHCYPVAPPTLSTVDEVHSELKAAMKYQMDEIIVLLRQALVACKWAEPLKVYAVACRYSFEDEGQKAMDVLAKTVRDASEITYIPELDEICAGPYYRLLQRIRTPQRRLHLHFPPRTNIFSQAPSTTAFGLSHNPHSTDKRHHAPVHPKHPFISTGADLTIRTADSIRYEVHRTILSLASPIFTRILKQIGNRGDADVKLPGKLSADSTIVVDEDSYTIDALLRYCYPVPEPTLDDIADVCELLYAAKKYQMNKVIDLLMRRWNELHERDPLRSYLLACGYGWAEQARSAARATLSRNIASDYVADMESPSVTAGAYYRLLQYHNACVNVVTVVCQYPHRWMPPEKIQRMSGQCGESYFTNGNTVCWMRKGLTLTIFYLKNSPGKYSGVADLLLEDMLTSRCSSVTCEFSTNIRPILEMRDMILKKLKRVVDEVQLEFVDIVHGNA